ncbi:MAG: hypothetical protein Q9200_003907 [Gallowayella weberi]
MTPNADQTASNDDEVTIQREVYTVFRKWEKVYIVSLITLAAWFSTVSSFIYYPVITFVARDLRTTVAKINLTVTAYMVVSGIAPALIGDLADQAGRRPTYMITLVVYFCANIGIALQDSFVVLLLLRMLQSAGISGDDILPDWGQISHNLPVDKVRGDDLLAFPVERARLRSAFIPIGIVAVTFIGYGWSLHLHAHLSIPLLLQFLLGLSVQMCFNINNTLLIDINYRTPATAQAASNIIRCALAALAVGVLEDVMGRIGIGWTFTLLGFGALGSGMLYWVDRRWGMRWRTEPGVAQETADGTIRADEGEKGGEMAKGKDGCEESVVNDGEKME